jgi:hypothetical protein
VIELRTDCTLLELESIFISLPVALSVKDDLGAVAAWNLIRLPSCCPARIMSPLTGLPVGLLDELTPEEDDGLEPEENPLDRELELLEENPLDRELELPEENPLDREELPEEKLLEREPPDENPPPPPPPDGPFPEISGIVPNKKAPATNNAKNLFITKFLKNSIPDTTEKYNLTKFRVNAIGIYFFPTSI